MRCLNVRDALAQAVGVADVALEGMGLEARVPELLGIGLTCRQLAAADDDCGAIVGKSAGDGGADASAGASDEGDAVGEVEGRLGHGVSGDGRVSGAGGPWMLQ